MSEDAGRLEWIHWPTMVKAMAVGIGGGLILAVALEDFVLGMVFGVANGLAFGIGWSRSRSRQSD
ncbi:hypothetical protein [Haloarcula marina]|uniref:hypothetical protein n=1 Tax=Haloarcula marina TaxID=2961574 RepID=UPI0020B8E959|nr:hypothetical protein [Halomicroarcula marina]